MGITKIAKLQRQLDAALDATRNAISATQAVRTTRDQALVACDEAQKKLDGMTSYATSQRQHIRRLFNSIFHLNLELARKAGYIDRVKEMDSGANGLRMETTPAPDLVASVVDGIDPDILDQVLARRG